MWSPSSALPHLLFHFLYPGATDLPEGLTQEEITSRVSGWPPRVALHYQRLWTLAKEELAAKQHCDVASDAEIQSVLENGSDVQRLRLIHSQLLDCTEQSVAPFEIFSDTNAMEFLLIALPMLLMTADASLRRKHIRMLLESSLVTEILVTLARFYPATIQEISEEIVRADQAQGLSTSTKSIRNQHVLERVAGVGRQAATRVRHTLTLLTHFPLLCLKISLMDTIDAADYLDSIITEDMSASSHWLLNTKVMSHSYGKQIVTVLISEVQRISTQNGTNSNESITYASKCMRCLAMLAFFVDLNELSSSIKPFSEAVQSMFQGGGSGCAPTYHSLYRHYICVLYGLLALLDSSAVSSIQHFLQRALLLSTSTNHDESFDPYFQFAFIIATKSMNVSGIEDIYCQILRVPHSFSKQFSNRSALLMKDAFQAISPIAFINKVNLIY